MVKNHNNNKFINIIRNNRIKIFENIRLAGLIFIFSGILYLIILPHGKYSAAHLYLSFLGGTGLLLLEQIGRRLMHK